MKLFIIFTFLIVPLISASYFRKEHIIKAEEITRMDNDDDYETNKIIKIETDEGNTYLLTNNIDGVLITDAPITNNWQTKNNINLRGYKTIGEVLEKVSSLNTDKQQLSRNKKNTKKVSNLRLRRVIEQ